jgi:CheY-like chemotaxis protein
MQTEQPGIADAEQQTMLPAEQEIQDRRIDSSAGDVSLAVLASLVNAGGQQDWARQIALGLGAAVCVIKRTGVDMEYATLAMFAPDGANRESISELADALMPRITAAIEPTIFLDISVEIPARRLPLLSPYTSCLGAPLIQGDGVVQGAIAVFAKRGHLFKTEAACWLKIATRIVISDPLFESVTKPEQQSVGLGSRREETRSPDRGVTILVVEDDRVINRMLSEYLSVHGYRVESAFDGLEAASMFRPADHHIVISDVAMPRMNGWELVAALHLRVPDLPVILITGYNTGGGPSHDPKANNTVTAVLNKPLDMRE